MLSSTPAPANALNLRRSNGQPKVVSLSTQRKPITNPETLYFVNGTLGTPAQTVLLHLDTGSSDLWVNSAQSDLCTERSNPCASTGTYDANSSSTYNYVGSYFNISYVDGSGAAGDYVTDTFTLGDTSLEDFQFGVGYTSTSEQGILGIGYPVNEVQVGRANMKPYENLPAKMVSAGQIQSQAYSLWLNDLDANKGSILFGGVDTDQYTGELQTLPIQANDGVYSEFKITLTGLSLAGQSIAEDQALAVLLDSGSSLTYLPDTWVDQIFEQVGAQYEASDGAAYVACDLASDSSTLDFTFTDPAISVEMNELVLDLGTASGGRPTFDDGTEACLFGIAPAGAGTNVLGDTFLRSAYVVYDLANNEISLAQTNFNATTTNVKEITGPGEVPGATAVADPVAATAGVVVGTSGSASTGIGIAGLGGSSEENAAPGLARSVSALVASLAFGVWYFVSMA
ncbi:hypothetical protein SLS62_008325 [Diatrype stigma]|uniref:Probable aspartic-type endopeptidase OPSB n=1 Tax=Diatrype stigma TaxID=117547 RepID=A0AAN9UJW4_9PEZI